MTTLPTTFPTAYQYNLLASLEIGPYRLTSATNKKDKLDIQDLLDRGVITKEVTKTYKNGRYSTISIISLR